MTPTTTTPVTVTPATVRPHVQRYTGVAMVLHWLVAALLLVNVVVGLAGDRPGSGRSVVDLHKSIGLTVLGLVILRILWRMARTPPPMPDTYSDAERRLAQVAHALLYAVMLLIPLTGYIHDSAWKGALAHPIVLYGLVHFPRLPVIKTLDPATKEQVHAIFFAAHVWLGYALYVLLALHLLGVVKHQAIDREKELQRMLPKRSPRAEPAEAAVTRLPTRGRFP